MIKQLSVIVPAYNEENHIEATLTEVAKYLISRNYEFEIIVVNDGSTDSTAATVRDLSRKYPQIKLIHRDENLGKGRTVREGIQHAKYPYCLFMDADNSTQITEWESFEKLFDKGFKAVIASRHMAGSEIVYPQPWPRRFLGTGYRILCRALFHLNGTDFNCGFKAYDTEIAKRIYENVVIHDWAFDVEVFCLLKKQDIPFAEAPVRWEHRDKASSLKPFKTAFKTFQSIAQLKRIY